MDRLTGMQMIEHADEQWGERKLGETSSSIDTTWKAMRGRFAMRAASEGLVDVAFGTHETPLGRVLVGATGVGVVRLALPIEDPDEVVEQLAQTISVRVLRAETPVLTRTRHELDEYFDGSRRVFGVPLDWQLSRAFRREVLRAATEIPYGATSSYARVALAAGSPRAVRAAGSALATNPIPILVPCHRVLRSDGAMGQYRGGTEAKALLLQLERG